MKISLNWLRALVALPDGTDAARVSAALTAQGLEIEGIAPLGREVQGVLVAEVLSVRPHPQADKLRLVRVRAGAREEEVVCGASNVPGPGGRVAWAAPGAVLPGGLKLEAREVRGVMSPGMLCSEKELGLADQVDGILILSPSDPSGVDLAHHLGLSDDVLEVNVTPNRPDALSHLGIARELSAHFGSALRWPSLDDVSTTNEGPTIEVRIVDPTASPRYMARFIAGLSVGQSPLSMRLRLAACGMRAISNVVDVTNYVLLETGHPLHAFDFDKLSGEIAVRRARDGETIKTLDGQERALVAGDIVIADSQQAVALAGVMGGATSEVSATTRNVLLEAATFDPTSVRRTAKRLGLHSEASYRFERGVDQNGVPYAANRAATLLAKLGGGRLVSAIVDRHPRPSTPKNVTLTTKRLARVTGVAYTSAFAAERLERLGFACTTQPDGVTVTVPTFRPDIAIEEDLVEEVLRMGEYGKAPTRNRVLSNATSRPNPEAASDRIRRLLASSGLFEIVSWGFVPRASLAIVSGNGKDPVLANGVAVKNPISADYEVMRTSLLPGLADALKRNLSRGVLDVALFEVGPVVFRAEKPGAPPVEVPMAAGILAGHRGGWLKAGEPLDFFDAKRVLEDLGAAFGVQGLSLRAPATPPFLHPGVSAEIQFGTTAAGAIGELHPAVARKLGIEEKAFYFELRVDLLEGATAAPRAVPPPRFPAATRDVSFWVDVSVSAAEQRQAFQAAKEGLLRDLSVLEDFRDPRYVPAGKKGMLWSMTYRSDERTLTDEEVDASHLRVIQALTERKDIQIR